jgi:hypothetical protein
LRFRTFLLSLAGQPWPQWLGHLVSPSPDDVFTVA